jgi:hypothetical protein
MQASANTDLPLAGFCTSFAAILKPATPSRFARSSSSERFDPEAHAIAALISVG